MDVRNADSLPRVGVCFCRDESLSALAVVYRGVEGGLSVFRGSDPLPAACCQLPPVFCFPGWIAIGSSSEVGCLLPAACCQLPPISRLSAIAASGRKGSGVFHSLS
jgi:hypothetical protein